MYGGKNYIYKRDDSMVAAFDHQVRSLETSSCIMQVESRPVRRKATEPIFLSMRKRFMLHLVTGEISWSRVIAASAVSNSGVNQSSVLYRESRRCKCIQVGLLFIRGVEK